MDVLTESYTKSYDYISRYSNFNYYYNKEDNKYIYGLISQLEDDVTYVLHTVLPTDDLDYLSNYYYGRPDYFWIIADFNRIQDPFIHLSDYFTTIKIPSMADLQYKN